MAERKKVRRKQAAQARKAKAGRRKRRAPRAAKAAKAAKKAASRTSRPAPRVRARPTRCDPNAARSARGSAPKTTEVATPPAATAAPLPPAAPRAHADALAVLASTPVRVGSVRHYFPRSRAARIAVDGALATGDRLHVRGATSDFLMEVSGLRVNGRSVERVAGGEATLAVPSRVRPGDALFALRRDA
jgi:hypothetical protein